MESNMIDTENTFSPELLAACMAPMTWKPEKGPGGTFTFDPARVPVAAVPTIIRGLVYQGFAIIMQRESAGAANVQEADEGRAARLTAWYKGEFTSRAGAGRIDPVLREMRGLVVQHGMMKSDAARKADEATIKAAAGAKFAALRKKAEAIVALAAADLDELPDAEVQAE